MMVKRSFAKFVERLRAAGLHGEIEKRAIAAGVSLVDLYKGPRTMSVMSARRSVFVYLRKRGKGVNEIARLFDRMPWGVSKLLNRKGW